MASGQPIEVELKLLLPAGARAALERHPALCPPRASAPQTRDETTVYFDTPELALNARSLTLRVRRRGAERIQTLKSAHDGAGVASSRGEWEWSVAQDSPDLACLADTPYGSEIAAIAADLQPVFSTEVSRTIRTLDLGGGSVAEAAMDEGRVVAGEAMQDIRELELELKQGSPGPLYRLALELHRDVAFTIGTESKSQRGVRLLTARVPKAKPGREPALDGDAPASEAIRRIIGAELSHFLASQPAAAAGDVEGVHQMRVGIRRLRSALALFEKFLEPHATRQFEAELRRLGQVFGAARDWDVFCTEILPAAGEEPGAKGWTDLLRPPAETARASAHLALSEEFARPNITALVLGMAAWVEPDDDGATLLGGAALHRPLRKLAPDLLDRMARRVARRGVHPTRRSATELHDLRKALKKLRYSTDFVASLYPGKSSRRYHKAVGKLQKLLGAGNDAVMATMLAERLSADAHIDLTPAAGALAIWGRKRHAKALRKLPAAWDGFREATPFWR